MATYNFTGANGDPLPAGLTAYNGTQQIQNNSLVAVSLPAGPQLNQCGANSTADGTFQAVFTGGGSTTNSTSGVFARRSDNSNMWQCLVNPNDGTLRLYKLVAASYTEILPRYTIPSFNAFSNYTIALVCSGTSIEAHVGGVSRISTTDSFNQTEIKAGIRFGNTSHRIDDLTIPDAVSSDLITIANAPRNNMVYQRTSSDIKSVSFAITYTGTPTSLQYRLLDASDDITEIVTWTTFDATPTGGTSTLTFNAPASTTGYHVEVRFSNNVAVTDLQSNDWYVGDNILIFGQSLSEDMNTDGAITVTEPYFVYNGSTSTRPSTGVGA
jgi:hypothetical protein